MAALISRFAAQRTWRGGRDTLEIFREFADGAPHKKKAPRPTTDSFDQAVERTLRSQIARQKRERDEGPAQYAGPSMRFCVGCDAAGAAAHGTGHTNQTLMVRATVLKGHAMTMHPSDPNYRRELEREVNEEGMSTAAWAGIAVAVMVVGGIAMYAFSNHESTTTASTPGIERSTPPATTGQGGMQPRTPAAKEKAD
jgi:hypothetical protein